ncbi:MAG TPA: prepilin-type N-terminal cleavage/methylation domain-containing protein [Candidatus Ozemobacteraceae bacterium]|nr:prepilin-type N-terminal cleavage/methylation domain-containing protein [Candidatus Ozemobacteraceae bacterium]
MIRSNRGFTLMELLLVIAILAIVAAAAAPSFFGGATDAMKEARRAAFVSNFNSVLSAANIYLANEQAAGRAGVKAGTVVYSALKDKMISAQTFNVKNSAGTVGTITAQIVQADATLNTFKVSMHQCKDNAGTVTGNEITDPGVTFDTFTP